ARNRQESENVVKAAKEIITACVEMGGSLSGEHGIGLEKNELMPLVFSEDDLAAMRNVKEAFGAGAMFNPGKVFPSGKMCGELRVQISAGV
ncbi:MAG: FAD-binding oxidoreductase, partial [Acidobacteria bacterium]|nr:FAD-binding oxidoreductase [Acidobacteriota bacterium]